MRKFLRIPALAALAVGATALPARAQHKATELTAGVLGLGYTTCSGCNGVLEVATGGASSGIFSGVGGGSLALGFYMSPRMAIEPTLAASVLSSSGSSGSSTTLTILSLGVAVPYYFTGRWGRKGLYLAPRVAYNSFSGTGTSSTSQVAMGLGLGTKVRLNDMAALRLQANFDYGLENSNAVATTSFGAFLGLSVFLK